MPDPLHNEPTLNEHTRDTTMTNKEINAKIQEGNAHKAAGRYEEAAMAYEEVYAITRDNIFRRWGAEMWHKVQ